MGGGHNLPPLIDIGLTKDNSEVHGLTDLPNQGGQLPTHLGLLRPYELQKRLSSIAFLCMIETS